MAGLLEGMNSRSPQTVLKSVKIISRLALESESTNALIAANKELITCLIGLLSSTHPSVSSAALNAVADLSVSSRGRQALQDSDLINHLLDICSGLADTLNSKYNCDVEEHFQEVLSIVNNLLLEHTELSLVQVPKNILHHTYICLRELWMQKQHIPTQEQEEDDGINKENGHAKLLAMLAMEEDTAFSSFAKESIEQIFMGDMKDFIENHWEQSPAITNKSIQNFFEDLFKELPMKSPSEMLNCLVKASVTCPPVSADELDPQQIMKEIHESLGHPILYQQDIRLVKSVNSSTEQHFFKDKRAVKPEDCIRAFESGYTVALRGMEFRSPTVAAICECLGTVFGQPSLGANLYLTPLNSQGLSLHYDDHCVFVVQLAGQKRWSIYTPEKHILPKLYAPRHAPEIGHTTPMSLLLREGDMLYIPRGYPHLANVDEIRKRKRCSMGTEVSNFSLHLTFGIEVEPTFEWEGFIHIAINNWFLHNQFHTKDERSCKMLLHFAVKGLADQRSGFRKACLISTSLVDHSVNRRIFKNLVNMILESDFDQAQRNIRDDDRVVSMRWLRHLQGGESFDENVEYTVESTVQLRDMLENLKTGFVRGSLGDEGVYNGACRDFVGLLGKYRVIRRKFVNAMLALHSLDQQ